MSTTGPVFHNPMRSCIGSLSDVDTAGITEETEGLTEDPSAAHVADALDPLKPKRMYSQEWFYSISGEAKGEDDAPQKPTLAFLAARWLEFRRTGRKVSSAAMVLCIGSANLWI